MAVVCTTEVLLTSFVTANHSIRLAGAEVADSRIMCLS